MGQNLRPLAVKAMRQARRGRQVRQNRASEASKQNQLTLLGHQVGQVRQVVSISGGRGRPQCSGSNMQPYASSSRKTPDHAKPASLRARQRGLLASADGAVERNDICSELPHVRECICEGQLSRMLKTGNPKFATKALKRHGKEQGQS